LCQTDAAAPDMCASLPDTLDTTRLWLEPWGEQHTQLLLRLSTNPEVMRYIGAGAVWTRAEATRIAAAQGRHWREHGFGWRPAREKSSGELIGFMALNLAGDGTVGLDRDEYELGWWLTPSAWGRGLAREGGLALRQEAFAVLGAPSVVARIQPANARSIKVAHAIGLIYDFKTTGRTGEPVEVYRLRATRHAADRATTPDRAGLSEGEHVRANSGVEERDLERPLGDRGRLPDQLMQARFGHGALALRVGIDPVGCPERLAVELHAEPHRLAIRRRPHYQV
jgi:RimJ/RimL family protein N-acetyltransferase